MKKKKCGYSFETITPHSELAIHMRVAGKKSKIVGRTGNTVYAIPNGFNTNTIGSVGELVDFPQRDLVKKLPNIESHDD